MVLYTTQDSTITIYIQTNVIAAYNRDTPSPYMQHRCAAAIAQVPMTQNITKIKTKQNVQTATKAHTRCGKKETALNTGDKKQGLNSCRNNYMLNYINRNNRQ